MSFIDDVKHKIGKYFLQRKKEKKREVETRNFELSRSIGLLFKAESVHRQTAS